MLSKKDQGPLIAHGANKLPLVFVDRYNLDVLDGKEIVNTRVRKGIFTQKLDEARENYRKHGVDPFGDTPTSEISKKQLGQFLNGENKELAAIINGVIEDFAGSIADAAKRFLQQKEWKGVERIVVGGGFKEGEVGERTVARAAVMLKMSGVNVDMKTISHHSDEAGLIGAVQLIPSWMLKGNDALLAVDIGGTNIRAGIVLTKFNEAKDFSKAEVWKSELWKHANDSPRRTQTVQTLVEMLTGLIRKAEKESLNLAPVIGVGCPGVIEPDGSISRGGQNLPGGNWESNRFNLPKALLEGIPTIGDHETFIIMHNDAVVQGLSQTPQMQDVKRWGVFTIGTGLGNACFTNGAS